LQSGSKARIRTGDHGSFNSWRSDRFWGLKDAPAAELPKLALLDMVKPNVIRNSRWRCDHGWDVDLDDGSSNYEIYNNLFLHGGLKLREGFHRKVWNNIAVNNSLHPHVWYENSGDEVTRNIWMGAYRPAVMKIAKWGKEVDYNLFTTSEADRARFAANGCDAHSLVGDPQFVDAATGDFRVKDGSPALKLGFQNFPMDRFGVRSPRLRAIARTPEIPAVKTSTGESSAATTEARWLGATLRSLIHYEFSAIGVAADAEGVFVADAPAQSAAFLAGLRRGDFIQRLNGRATRNAREFLDAVKGFPEGKRLKLAIIRDQQPMTLEISTRTKQ